jgi:hypothetical protein
MNGSLLPFSAKRFLDRTILITALVIGQAAQAQLGLAGSDHNGLWDLETQPASISYGKNDVEFNLVKFSANVDNDFIHLSRLHLGSLRLSDVSTNGDLTADAARVHGTRALDVDSRILGPSLMMRFGKTSLAFTTGVRARMDVTGLEGLLRLLDADALDINVQENTRLGILRFGSRQLAWGEAGITVAQRFHLNKRVRVHVAASGKLLLGMHGAFIQNDAPTLTLNLNTQELRDVNITYGMSDLEATAKGKLIQGTGVGVDAGIVLELLHDRRCGKEEAKHLLRFGAAITDLGGISFRGKAHSNSIVNGRTTLAGFADLAIDDIASVDTALSHLLLGDAHASEQQQGLRMALPTALRMSIDWNVTGQLYLHAAGTFGMDRGVNSVREPDVVSIAPRFGGRKCEVALPVSLYRLKEPRIGLNVRVGGFMVGSDKVGALLGLTDFGGMDVYMGVRFALRG